MREMRSFISVFLILAMLFALVACSGGSSGGGNETTADKGALSPGNDTTVSGIEYEADSLPDSLDFGGDKVVILSPSSGIAVNDITVEELSSDVVNDSIFNRERSVEDRLGVEIENYKTKDMGTEISKQTGADDDMYQIIVGETYDYSKYSFEGILYDLYTVDNLDLDKPWWSNLFINEATIDGSLYIATGSISLSLLRNLMVVYYNKNIAESYRQNNEALADLGDLYSVVDRGDWTLDKFHSLSSEVYEDTNGSTTRDEEDVYGLGLHFYSLDAIWSAFDLNVLSSTNDGWFELDVNTDKLFGALEKTTDLIYNSNGTYIPEDFTTVNSTASGFASGRYLFAVDYLNISEGAALRNMADEYGVLPFPKLDSAQKDYYSYAYDTYLSYSIPLTNPSPEIAGAVMEAMASYSYRDTAPNYLDVALKGKYMNDPQSRKMIDIIVNNFKLDTAWIYIFTIGSDYPSSYRSNILKNERGFASEHEKNARNVSKRLLVYQLQYDEVAGK